MSQYLLLLPILLPIVAGVLMGTVSLFQKKGARRALAFTTLMVNLVLSIVICLMKENELVIWYITKNIPVYLHVDDIGRIFLLLVNVMWTLAGVYSFEYMQHEKNEPRFYAYYLITIGVLSALSLAGNIITFYMFYEMMTLMTLPLVLHNMKKEAVAAGIKYLIYSVFGASCALLGIFFMNNYLTTLNFTAGGALNLEAIAGNEGTFLFIIFVTLLGFSTKAGMFPLHGWLPTAHPVAPAPASAVLSGVITKMGVLGIIRVIFFMVGPQFIKNTWVQTAFLTLTLITVFMGSMLAFKENGFKKRLAYSTVSQISYILFGLITLSPLGFVGALLHVVFHSIIKNTLFMGAGAVIYKTGKTDVSDLRGIGKQMPKTMLCFTIVSLGLIGIPPTGGFISKWYLAQGALQMGTQYDFIGPVILLISAILTAAYLLTISIRGFFPGKDFDLSTVQKNEVSYLMLVPMGILSILIVLLGAFPHELIAFFTNIANTVF